MLDLGLQVVTLTLYRRDDSLVLKLMTSFISVHPNVTV